MIDLTNIETYQPGLTICELIDYNSSSKDLFLYKIINVKFGSQIVEFSVNYAEIGQTVIWRKYWPSYNMTFTNVKMHIWNYNARIFNDEELTEFLLTL